MPGEFLKKAQETGAESPLHLRDLIGYHLKRASAWDLHGANTALEAAGLRTVSMSVLLTITERPGVSAPRLIAAVPARARQGRPPGFRCQ